MPHMQTSLANNNGSTVVEVYSCSIRLNTFSAIASILFFVTYTIHIMHALFVWKRYICITRIINILILSFRSRATMYNLFVKEPL